MTVRIADAGRPGSEALFEQNLLGGRRLVQWDGRERREGLSCLQVCTLSRCMDEPISKDLPAPGAPESSASSTELGLAMAGQLKGGYL